MRVAVTYSVTVSNTETANIVIYAAACGLKQGTRSDRDFVRWLLKHKGHDILQLAEQYAQKRANDATIEVSVDGEGGTRPEHAGHTSGNHRA